MSKTNIELNRIEREVLNRLAEAIEDDCALSIKRDAFLAHFPKVGSGQHSKSSNCIAVTNTDSANWGSTIPLNEIERRSDDRTFESKKVAPETRKALNIVEKIAVAGREQGKIKTGLNWSQNQDQSTLYFYSLDSLWAMEFELNEDQEFVENISNPPNELENFFTAVEHLKRLGPLKKLDLIALAFEYVQDYERNFLSRHGEDFDDSLKTIIKEEKLPSSSAHEISDQDDPTDSKLEVGIMWGEFIKPEEIEYCTFDAEEVFYRPLPERIRYEEPRDVKELTNTLLYACDLLMLIQDANEVDKRTFTHVDEENTFRERENTRREKENTFRERKNTRRENVLVRHALDEENSAKLKAKESLCKEVVSETIDSVSKGLELAQKHFSDKIVIPQHVLNTAIEDLGNTEHSQQFGKKIYRALGSLSASPGPGLGSYHQWCIDGLDPYSWSEKDHARKESEQVENNAELRKYRYFVVDEAVNSSGEIYMGAHMKISSKGIAPRIYFHDDRNGQTGKIHIGYIGRHLPTSRRPR